MLNAKLVALLNAAGLIERHIGQFDEPTTLTGYVVDGEDAFVVCADESSANALAAILVGKDFHLTAYEGSEHLDNRTFVVVF